jgi:hypothetical protein
MFVVSAGVLKPCHFTCHSLSEVKIFGLYRKLQSLVAHGCTEAELRILYIYIYIYIYIYMYMYMFVHVYKMKYVITKEKR